MVFPPKSQWHAAAAILQENLHQIDSMLCHEQELLATSSVEPVWVEFVRSRQPVSTSAFVSMHVLMYTHINSTAAARKSWYSLITLRNSAFLNAMTCAMTDAIEN